MHTTGLHECADDVLIQCCAKCLVGAVKLISKSNDVISTQKNYWAKTHLSDSNTCHFVII